MPETIKSAWGIIYYISKEDKQPRFFLIKRHAFSGKIERVAPKWKIEQNEQPQQTVIREISEETQIKPQNLKVQSNLWKIIINLHNKEKEDYNKEIIYYLVEYSGDFSDINIENIEWYLWYHKWASIQEISGLIYYENFRNILMKAYNEITKNQKH